VFYARYAISELRRRRGRTVLTALGLAVGVGLVVTVTALSNGLDDAQTKVLKPLTGVGTDMSVTRPIDVGGGGGGFRGLSPSEQDQLRKENGVPRFGLRGVGKPGSRFTRDNFLSAQLSFPQSEVGTVSKLHGVAAAAPALTLNELHVSGTVPKQAPGAGPRLFAGPPGGEQSAAPNAVSVDQSTVSGVDTSRPDLALVTPGQVGSGSWFKPGASRQAVLGEAYARRKQLHVGSTLSVGGKRYTVVGIARPPLGGQASDVYVRLDELQKLSGRAGRVNALQVRATGSGAVGSVASAIRTSFPGAQVTTAKDLADRVSGSLVDAKSLSDKLGTALAIVALAAAFLIASLLTLSSVAKRTRELGTLKALGWSQRLVVRQITGESLAQGTLGGLAGAALGIGGAALVTAFAPALKATVAQAAPAGPGPLAFGQGQLATGSQTVTLSAPVDVGLVLLAVGLAVAGGLIAGAAGGGRAARLRPAAALRSIE
jgi:ABC-type antimicrobial peptide transport system permease subunit